MKFEFENVVIEKRTRAWHFSGTISAHSKVTSRDVEVYIEKMLQGLGDVDGDATVNINGNIVSAHISVPGV